MELSFNCSKEELRAGVATFGGALSSSIAAWLSMAMNLSGIHARYDAPLWQVHCSALRGGYFSGAEPEILQLLHEFWPPLSHILINFYMWHSWCYIEDRSNWIS